MADDRALYEALLRVKNDKALEPVREWLEKLRETERNQLETLTTNVQIAQGRAQMLKQILDSIDNSAQILSKIAK